MCDPLGIRHPRLLERRFFLTKPWLSLHQLPLDPAIAQPISQGKYDSRPERHAQGTAKSEGFGFMNGLAHFTYSPI